MAACWERKVACLKMQRLLLTPVSCLRGRSINLGHLLETGPPGIQPKTLADRWDFVFFRMKLLEEENNNFTVNMFRLKSQTVKLDEVKRRVRSSLVALCLALCICLHWFVRKTWRMLCFVQIVAFSLISAEIMCTGTVHGLTCAMRNCIQILSSESDVLLTTNSCPVLK